MRTPCTGAVLCLALSGLVSAQEPQETAPQPRPPVKVVLVGPASGEASAIMASARLGAELRLRQLVAPRGLHGRPVQLTFEDDQGEAEAAAAVARRLARDPNVVAVIGHFNSACSESALEHYDRAGLVMLSPGSTQTMLCRRSKWAFRNLYDDDLQAESILRYARDELGTKRVAVIYQNDVYGKGLRDVVVQLAPNKRLEVVSDQGFEPQSFAAEAVLDALRKPAQTGAPLVVFFAGLYPEGAKLARALRQRVWPNVTLVASDGTLHRAFRQQAGEAAEGVLIATPYHFRADSPEAKAFARAYRQKVSGAEPDVWAGLTYDAVGMILHALTEVGPQRDAIRGWLADRHDEKSAYEGVTGATWFDAQGDCPSKPALFVTAGERGFELAERQLKRK